MQRSKRLTSWSQSEKRRLRKCEYNGVPVAACESKSDSNGLFGGKANEACEAAASSMVIGSMAGTSQGTMTICESAACEMTSDAKLS